MKGKKTLKSLDADRALPIEQVRKTGKGEKEKKG